MSLVVRKMPVPTTAPIVMSAPSHAPSARTRPTGGSLPRSSTTRSEAAIRGEAICRPGGGQTRRRARPGRILARDELRLAGRRAQQFLEGPTVVDHVLAHVFRVV